MLIDYTVFKSSSICKRLLSDPEVDLMKGTRLLGSMFSSTCATRCAKLIMMKTSTLNNERL